MTSYEYVHIQKDIESLNIIGKTLLNDIDFCDVTLVCADNQHLPAHRAVICTGSNFLRELLYDSQQQRTFLYFGQVHLTDLRPLIDFLYLGSCYVERSKLEIVQALAADLQISGFFRISEATNKISCLEKTNDKIIEDCIMYEGNEKHDNGFLDLDSSKLQDEKTVAVETKDTDASFTVQNLTEKIIVNKQLKSKLNQDSQEYSSFIGEGATKQTHMPTLNRSLKLPTKQKTGKKKVNKLPKTEVVDPDSNGMYNCDKCKASLKSLFRFRRHKLTRHEGFVYTCDQCTSQFKSTVILRRHVEFVHEGLAFKCDECEKQLDKKQILLHRAKMRKCDQCSFFSCSRKVTKHSLLVHSNFYRDGTFHCNQCDYQTNKLQRMIYHKRIFHNGNVLICDQCEYTTKIKSNMNQHTEEKHLMTEYQCQKCEFRGTKKKVWAHKIKIHEKREYTCKDCEYVGKSQSKLGHHRQKIHLMIDYSCKVCNIKFVSSSSYRRHMKQQHESQPISCDQCSYIAKTSQYLEFHIKTNHMEIIWKQCAQCSFKTKSKYTLQVHRETIHEGLTYHCEKCGKNINHPKSIRKHKSKCGSQIVHTNQKFNSTKVTDKKNISKSLKSPKQKLDTQELMENETIDQIPLACESQDCCRTSVEC